MEQEQIFNMLMDKDDITWQSIIYDLVRTEKMDPWNVDVSVLTQKYLELIKQLKEFDFRLSGKIVLAAAVMLKIKSKRLLGADLANLDRLFAETEEAEDELDLDEEYKKMYAQPNEDDLKLIPRTPQPRRRKVSIYELMDALEKAIEVKYKLVVRTIPDVSEIKLPEKKKDITQIIREIYTSIKSFFYVTKNQKKLTFSRLIPSSSKEDKVYTFIPLLHLSNARKIDLLQEQHFGEIEIQLLKKLKHAEDLRMNVENQKKNEEEN